LPATLLNKEMKKRLKVFKQMLLFEKDNI